MKTRTLVAVVNEAPVGLQSRDLSEPQRVGSSPKKDSNGFGSESGPCGA